MVVLAVFHDFNLAARYCDALILLNNGKIVAIGSCEDVLTSRNIKEVFGVNVVVKRHPITGSLYTVPLPKTHYTKTHYKKNSLRRLRTHLVCGGGSGGELMRKLLELGCKVSVGVLNVIDSDYETAEALNIPVVSEAPFSSITEEAHEANLNMVKASDVVVVANIPFGFGNLRNLEAAIAALHYGITTLIIEETSPEERDFTRGEAKKMLEMLRSAGAVVVKSPHEALSFIENLEKGRRTVRPQEDPVS